VNKDKKHQWYDSKLFLVFIIFVGLTIIFVNFYLVWDAATTKGSAQIRCKIDHIRYVELVGNGTCMFALVDGDVGYCALPEDVECEGLVQDFPIIKGLMKLRK
jgi:hypothetical protein